MKRLDLFRAAQKGALGIAAPIVEFDYIVERGGLSVTEVRSCLGDLTKGLGPPETHRNGLLAEIAVACRLRIITETSIDIKVAIGD